MLTYVLHNGVSSFPEQIKAKCSTYGNIKMSKDSFMQIQPEAVIFLQSFSTNVAHLKHRVDELFFNPTWIWLDTNIWRPKSRWLVLYFPTWCCRVLINQTQCWKHTEQGEWLSHRHMDIFYASFSNAGVWGDQAIWLVQNLTGLHWTIGIMFLKRLNDRNRWWVGTAKYVQFQFNMCLSNI